MSILIKDMEMPKEFDPDVYIELACGIDGKRYARLYNFHQGGLTEWCEAVPVPPHGDLIERQTAVDACFDGWNNSASDCATNIRSVPAVIPADEGET